MCDDTDPNSECAKEKKKEEDCNKLDIADNVYSTKNGIPNSDNGGLNSTNTINLSPSSNALKDLDIDFSNEESGFTSSLYKIEHEDGTTEIVYAFAGSDDFADWTDANSGQFFGEDTEQYNWVIENALAVKGWADNNGYSLSFTGHSLGGGLATGSSAFVFNPSGIHNNTIADPRLNIGHANNIEGYVVRGEIVAGSNLLNSEVNAIGNLIKIAPKGIAMTSSTLSHFIFALRKALGCDE